jgi:hypothetical protein
MRYRLTRYHAELNSKGVLYFDVPIVVDVPQFAEFRDRVVPKLKTSVLIRGKTWLGRAMPTQGRTEIGERCPA